MRATALTGHLHPVKEGQIDLRDTRITTSGWDEANVVELLQTSRIAVYPGDIESSPAAMWECLAADLPIVVNEQIWGGRHVVVPGVTGEFANQFNFGERMRYVLENRRQYAPRQCLVEKWDTVAEIERSS